MIGNEADARTALNDYVYGYYEYLLSDNGTTRSIHLVNNVVYKVFRNEYCRRISENTLEYKNFLRMRKNLPAGVKVPDMYLWDIDGTAVLACEYIPGIPTGECLDIVCGHACEHNANECLSYDFLESLKTYGFHDWAYGNAMWLGSDLYLIDIA